MTHQRTGSMENVLCDFAESNSRFRPFARVRSLPKATKERERLFDRLEDAGFGSIILDAPSLMDARTTFESINEANSGRNLTIWPLISLDAVLKEAGSNDFVDMLRWHAAFDNWKCPQLPSSPNLALAIPELDDPTIQAIEITQSLHPKRRPPELSRIARYEVAAWFGTTQKQPISSLDLSPVEKYLSTIGTHGLILRFPVPTAPNTGSWWAPAFNQTMKVTCHTTNTTSLQILQALTFDTSESAAKVRGVFWATYAESLVTLFIRPLHQLCHDSNCKFGIDLSEVKNLAELFTLLGDPSVVFPHVDLSVLPSNSLLMTLAGSHHEQNGGPHPISAISPRGELRREGIVAMRDASDSASGFCREPLSHPSLPPEVITKLWEQAPSLLKAERRMNARLTHLSILVSKTQANPPLALLFPTHSLQRSLQLCQWTRKTERLEISLADTTNLLRRFRCNFHLLDDNLLSMAKIHGDKLCAGSTRYHSVVITQAQGEPPEMWRKLSDFFVAGGNVLCLCPPPPPRELKQDTVFSVWMYRATQAYQILLATAHEQQTPIEAHPVWHQLIDGGAVAVFDWLAYPNRIEAELTTHQLLTAHPKPFLEARNEAIGTGVRWLKTTPFILLFNESETGQTFRLRIRCYGKMEKLTLDDGHLRPHNIYARVEDDLAEDQPVSSVTTVHLPSFGDAILTVPPGIEPHTETANFSVDHIEQECGRVQVHGYSHSGTPRALVRVGLRQRSLEGADLASVQLEELTDLSILENSSQISVIPVEQWSWRIIPPPWKRLLGRGKWSDVKSGRKLRLDDCRSPATVCFRCPISASSGTKSTQIYIKKVE